MNTYWLTCRDGPIPPVKDEIAWFADMQPVFLETTKKSTEQCFNLR